MPIHSTAIVDPTAQVHPSADVGPYVQIGAGSVVGEGCVLMTGAIVCDNVRMGANNRVHFHAVLGGDPQFIGFDRSRRTGVVIGDGNEFREYFQVHRAIPDGADTVIGNNNYFMAGSHVAHDCHVGNNVTMVNYAALAGHCEVQDRAFLSGHVGVHQFCRIGRLAMVGGIGGVTRDVPPFLTVKGDLGFLVGVNVIGMRRAGIGPEGRLAVRTAFRRMFRSGHSLPKGIELVREEWTGKQMPAELEELLSFCETKSKRGFMTSRTPGVAGAATVSESDTVE